MNREEIAARAAANLDEMRELAAKESLSEDEEARWAELEQENESLAAKKERLDKRDAALSKIAEVAKNPASRTRSDTGVSLDRDPLGEPRSIEMDRRESRNPWDWTALNTLPGGDVSSEIRSRALSAIAQSKGTTDERRKAATNIVEKFDDKDGKLARMMLTISDPDYLSAFAKAARGQNYLFTPEEQRAVARAMSLTDASGGYLVPFQLDPTVIITSDGSVNDIRMISRQVVATGDVWNGVSSAAVSWSWDSEAAQVSDDATTFAQPSITVHKAAGFVPISLEAMADIPNVTEEVGRLLAFGKDTLEATAFATGSGSGQPYGIVTALTGTSSEINAAADDTFAVVDVYSTYNGVAARYRQRASWLANNAIYTLIRRFDTSSEDGALWTTLGTGTPQLLLGRPTYEAEAMDSTVTTSGAVSNFILVFGDFSNYVIADRVGTTVEFIPHLFGTADNRPTGQRGWYAYFRAGADSVNDGAFTLLDVPSAA